MQDSRRGEGYTGRISTMETNHSKSEDGGGRAAEDYPSSRLTRLLLELANTRDPLQHPAPNRELMGITTLLSLPPQPLHQPQS